MILNTNLKNKSYATNNPDHSDFGIRASDIDISNLPVHIKPEQIRDEIPTLNKTGYMKFEFEHFSKSFVEYARAAQRPVLEIGTAYGWVTHKVLETGATIVAADICQEHLEVLLKETKEEHLDKLYVYRGAFPEELAFKPKSFDAIFMSRILHFLKGEEVERGLKKIHSWLAPKGKFIATNCSIYHSSVKKNMHKIFEERIALKHQWPGLVTKEDFDKVHENYSPSFLNTFYKEQLEELMPKHGFKIETIEYFDYPSDPWPDEGKGHIGFIASKI